jgi:iron complex outermembrane receptor protein
VSEIDILSKGSGRLKWVAGAFYFNQDVGLLLGRDNYHTVDFVASNSTIETKPSSQSKSLFAQANYFLTDRLELLGGARNSWDRQTVDRLQLPGPGTLPNRGTATSQEWTGKIGANYHLGENLLYFTASKGYKAGGTNLQANSPNFGPETNFVYEFGVKSELLDRHVRINGDVFYSDYRNLQFASLSGGLPLTQNAAKAESKGAELEVALQYAGLGANLGASYLDASFAADACLNDTNSTITSPECSPGNRLVPKGSTLPYSPTWTINAGIQCEFALGGNISLTPRVQWSHLDGQLATPFPSIATNLPGRDVFDARVTLKLGHRFKVEAFATNFTDKTYVASQIQDASSATGGYVYGAPRQFGVRLVAKFGN